MLWIKCTHTHTLKCNFNSRISAILAKKCEAAEKDCNLNIFFCRLANRACMGTAVARYLHVSATANATNQAHFMLGRICLMTFLFIYMCIFGEMYANIEPDERCLAS